MAAEADYYTPGEVANALGLSEGTVLSLLTSGQLEGEQDEWARWRIPARAVASAIEQARQDHRVPDSEAPTVISAGSAEAAAETTADNRTESGWVTTAQAARALRISPRTVRWHIEHGNLEAKTAGEGVQRTWLVSVDSLQAFRDARQSRRNRRAIGDSAESASEDVETTDQLPQADYQETIRLLAERLAAAASEAGELRGRLELTQTAESTLRESLERERERADRLEEELRDERSKGFWQRLFGG
jgi:excisionase family DNA binding protein